MKDSRSYQEAWQNMVVAAGGPVLAVVGNAMRGLDYAAKGEVVKAIEASVPKFARDAIRSFRLAHEGMTDYNGNVIVGKEKFGAGSAVSQALGLTPATVARTYEGRNAQKTRETQLRDRRTSLMQQWRRSDNKVEFFATKIAKFNADNPEFRISPKQLRQSMMEQLKRESRTSSGYATQKANIRERGAAYATE